MILNGGLADDLHCIDGDKSHIYALNSHFCCKGSAKRVKKYKYF